MQQLKKVKVCFSIHATYGTGSIHHKRLTQLCRTSRSLRFLDLVFEMKLSYARWNFYFSDTAEKRDDIDRCMVELAAIQAEKYPPGEGPPSVNHVYWANTIK